MRVTPEEVAEVQHRARPRRLGDRRLGVDPRDCFAVPVPGDPTAMEILVILAAAFGGWLVGYAQGRRR